MWRVLVDFADSKDGMHVYHAGDNYPHKGTADKQRLIELSGRNNKRGTPLIEEYSEPKPRKKRKTD